MMDRPSLPCQTGSMSKARSRNTNTEPEIVRRTARWDFLSSLLPNLAGVIGQGVMLVFMLVGHNYLYLVFLVPGLISSLAFVFIIVVRYEEEKRRLQSQKKTAGLGDRPESSKDSALTHPGTSPFSGEGISSPGDPLQVSANALGQYLPAEESPVSGIKEGQADSLNWRRIVALWLRSDSSPQAAVLSSSATTHSDAVEVGMPPATVDSSDFPRPSSLSIILGSCLLPGKDAPQKAPLAIDLNRQGPHALVAGTTGSGKSLFLENWCLSLACHYSPQELHFIFLDFKGGATFQTLRRLPHTVGNVSDLDIAHALRALLAIEEELKRRETLVQEQRCSNIDQLSDPPARLIIVVDEFHALKEALPDYIPRLVSLAALGRSLGMHLIACTQSPMGQISNEMKANLSLHICLRVRDPLQSIDLLSTPLAASISPQEPGIGYLNDGDSCFPFRCFTRSPHESQRLVSGIKAAARFMACARNERPTIRLFSRPLPRSLPWAELPPAKEPSLSSLLLGLQDDGVVTSPWFLPLDGRTLAVIAPRGCGKSTVLAIILRSFLALHSGQGPPPNRLALCDDAEPFLDPFAGAGLPKAPGPSFGKFSQDSLNDQDRASPIPPLAQDLKEAVACPGVSFIHSREDFTHADRDPHTTLIYTVSEAHLVHYPQNCQARIIIPSRDKATDLLWGLPSELLSDTYLGKSRIPGRGFYWEETPIPVQFFTQLDGGTP